VADFLANQQSHREAFGKAITLWMKLNGWSQQVTDDFGKAVGQPGPHNSQISQLQNAKLNPKSEFWVCLGAFNQAVAAQDLKEIKTRALMDRLKGADAFLLDDGTPARGTDFFSMFIGEMPIPAPYRHAAAPASQEQVTKANDQLRKHFLAGAWARELEPDVAMKQLWKTISLPTKERPRLKKVLAGWDEYSAAELEDGLLMASLKAWAEKA